MVTVATSEEHLIIVVPISCTREYTEAVKMYQQIQTMDTSYSWCGLGLAFSLNGNGQEAVKGVVFNYGHCANNPVLFNSIYSSTSIV